MAPPEHPGSVRASGVGPDPGRELRGRGPRTPPAIVEASGASDLRRREAYYRRALALADATAIVVALAWASVLGRGVAPRLALLLAPLTVVLAQLGGLYDRDALLIRKTSTLDEVPALLGLATLLVLLAAVAEAGIAPSPGAETLVTLWLVLAAALVLFRSSARRFALRHTPPERCLVVGDADAMGQLERKLTGNEHTNSQVVGYVPMRNWVRNDDPEPLGTLADLEAVVRSHAVHRVIVAPRDAGADRSLEVVMVAKALGVRVSLLPRIFEVVGSSVAFDDIDGVTVLGVRRFGLSRSAAAGKRALDLAGSALGLLMTSPLLALAAAAVKLDSPGPVFFRQRRVGRDGEEFEIVKLRTMVADADARREELAHLNETEGVFKMTGDPRITRVGRWLRRTSLDELPQLINVLRGEMSLVGPRPLMPVEDRLVEGWHRRRLHISPGITGPWQILGTGRIPLYEMVKIDYLYVANWSLWGDVKILLRTAAYMARGRNG